MRHTLGTVAFSVPDEWRDDSTYVFMSPDHGGTILVEIPTMRDPQDAASLLAAAVANHRAVYDSLVIYVDHLPAGPAVGMSVAAVEGEQEAINGGGTRTRFAIAALESPRQRALMTFLISSCPDFLKVVRKVVESVTFADAAVPRIASVGMKRAQANFVHMDVPADWRSPETLSFLHRDFDRVALRVTIGEPVVPDGTLDVSKEIPGRVQVLAKRIEPANTVVRGARGWNGEWLVECGAPPARVILRKAVWGGETGQPATMYGQAPEPLLALLEAGWKLLRSSIHSFGGP